MSDPIQACAELVARGDPVRFRATMAAPLAVRKALFPLYALNLEVARAPWLTEEPMIAEMRLQFWRDVVEEAGAGNFRIIFATDFGRRWWGNQGWEPEVRELGDRLLATLPEEPGCARYFDSLRKPKT